MTDLSKQEMLRYARHLQLPEVGVHGQQRLREARVLCVGAGGLGSPAAMYLAAAGVGHLGIVDFDVVELSNLQRQLLHGTSRLGQRKTSSACATLRDLNPDIEVVGYEVRLGAGNAMELIGGYDLVVDGTDNFPTRYLVNDACVFLRKPLVYGSIFRWEGQASLFAPHLGGPCYRCLFPEPPAAGTVPNCAEGGVLGVLPGVLGCIQATEVLKLVLGQGRSLLGRFLLFDALAMEFRELRLRRDPACPVCGERPRIRTLEEAAAACAADPASVAAADPREVSVHEMKRALDQPELGITVIDVREPEEWEFVRVPGVQSLPLSALAQRWTELDPSRPYYVHCKAGARSLRAVEFLEQHGFRQVKSVRGGLQDWAATIDPGMTLY